MIFFATNLKVNVYKFLFGFSLSGRTWLDRFAKEWSEVVKFYTKGEMFQLENDPITMRD